MGYEELSLKSFIDDVRSVTKGTHPRKFCFVLGAGASRDSGIKSGQELVGIWDDELRERNPQGYQQWRKELGITDENRSSFYSQYYEKRFARCPSDGLNFIERIMQSAEPSAGYAVLAYLLTETPHNVVITTNFDHLTEDAVSTYTQETPLVVGHEALAHYITGNPVRPTVIKIHRDLLFDPKSRPDDLEALHQNWQDALRRVFENYHPVFIGYAGNDKSLMNFLIENATMFADNFWKFPYWLLYKNDPLEGRVKEFLEKSCGYYTYHDGFENAMIWLGAELGYKMPREEDFVNTAKTRFSKLKDAIDAFSDRSKDFSLSENVTNDPLESAAEAPATQATEDDSNVNEAIAKITSQSEQQAKYREASVLFNAKKYSEAAAILSELVAQEPGNTRYQFRLGDTLRQMKNYEEALPYLTTAIQLAPNYAQAHYSRAMTLEALGNMEEALAEYQLAAQLDPEQVVPCYGSIRVLNKMENKAERTDEILAHYNEAAERLERKQPFDAANAKTYAITLLNISSLQPLEERVRTVDKLRALNEQHDGNEEIALRYAKGLFNLTVDQTLEDCQQTVAILRKLWEQYSGNEEIALYFAEALFNLGVDQESEDLLQTVAQLRDLWLQYRKNEEIAQLYAEALRTTATDRSKEYCQQVAAQYQSIWEQHKGNKDIAHWYAEALVNLTFSQEPGERQPTIDKARKVWQQHQDNEVISATYATILHALTVRQSLNICRIAADELIDLWKRHPGSKEISQILGSALVNLSFVQKSEAEVQNTLQLSGNILSGFENDSELQLDHAMTWFNLTLQQEAEALTRTVLELRDFLHSRPEANTQFQDRLDFYLQEHPEHTQCYAPLRTEPAAV